MQDGDRKLLDEAFVAGLLHDTGKLVLASNFPVEYDQVLRSERTGSLALLTAEEHTFGANHAEIGGFLLGLWGLPVPVVEAIALHHQPGSSPHLSFSALTAVHVATALVNLQQAQENQVFAEELDLNYLEKLGIDGHLEHWKGLANSKPQPQKIKP